MGLSITLNNDEIQKALSTHVSTLGINTVGKQVNVTLTASRKGGGHSAVVEISDVVPGSAQHSLDNLTTAEANNIRVGAIKQTGTDAVGHASENTAEIANAPTPASVEEVPVVSAANTDDEVELTKPTPETAGHETVSTGKSLFD